MSDEGLPQDLGQLFSDGGAGRVLDVDLPRGELAMPKEHGGRFWVSEGPASADLWIQLHQAHPRSGLWPVFFNETLGTPGRLWLTGSLPPRRPKARIDGLDADAVLEGFWAGLIGDGEPDEEYLWMIEPFGRTWPGLAPATAGGQDPDVFADQYLRDNDDGTSRILLVPAARSADVITAVGWMGPCNFSDNPPLSAVLRSWEERFGARVIEIGSDVLHLTVAAPPVAAEHAKHVAAEHNAFNRDVVCHYETISDYAARAIQGKNDWSFWWD
jgi:hypothetical protein